ncbi:1,3-beta-glucan synthase [Basidiobolus meristosporus CBS 931.73]|uniref:1,3-beta-glucan synthase n=1 Tax=Basidiobolus meristosporus CBS 931.73 TaxID=1314790 RepID=A0A1Y1XVG4_9FUNG|nr:1,3-beta-glucan synthase [Basidiobolus meristosporus CBS 931.73]|eukprot:ORX89476.1 1,3-beta-glucan synthase [Basidiobolus meristosporus CBS 931.73]
MAADESSTPNGSSRPPYQESYHMHNFSTAEDGHGSYHEEHSYRTPEPNYLTYLSDDSDSDYSSSHIAPVDGESSVVGALLDSHEHHVPKIPAHMSYVNSGSSSKAASKEKLSYHSDYDSNSAYSDSLYNARSNGPGARMQGTSIDSYSAPRHGTLGDSRYAKYAPSCDSLVALLETKKNNRNESSTSINNSRSSSRNMSRSNSWFSGDGTPPPAFDYNNNSLPRPFFKDDPYPSWAVNRHLPVSREEIKEIFARMQECFGFQVDNMRNQYDALMVMLDSRASRMAPYQALATVHADYIGGENANYKKWYFCAHLNRDNPEERSKRPQETKKKKKMAFKKRAEVFDGDDIEAQDSHECAEESWRIKMAEMSQHDRVGQLALYLMIWGEAANIRFVPEAICFIFKICWDYYSNLQLQGLTTTLPEGHFLQEVITPLYTFIRDQSYDVIHGKLVKKDKDHSTTIGYDDVNEFFWTSEALERIVLDDKKTVRLMDFSPTERFMKLGEVKWELVFRKTYKERRSWSHLLVNFSRFWILHIVMFYFYTMGNATWLYTKHDEKSTPVGVHLGIVAFGGALASFIQLLAAICEYFFIPLQWVSSKILLRRIGLILAILILNCIAGAYTVIVDRASPIATAVGVVGLIIAVFTFCYFAIVPSSQLFARFNDKGNTKNFTNRTFTSNFPRLKDVDRMMSIGLWACVFGCKYIESYFYLALSFKDPLKHTGQYAMAQCAKTDTMLVCQIMNGITLFFMVFLDLILFFLDTYLWYIIINSLFSVARSFYLGVSIWSPWRNVFSRLPKRIYTKILSIDDMELKYQPKVLCSQIWNAIVISMYRDHLLSVEHVQKLLYQQVTSSEGGRSTLKAPSFFISHEDTSFKTEYFPKGSDAERRVSFFAQSLSTPLPETIPVENMPTFTVFTPHYSEKIILSLREVIREEDRNSKITLLEYLKKLYPAEWENFVNDTKVLAEENNMYPSDNEASFQTNKSTSKRRLEELPLHCVGFKTSAPEYTLRTRIWSSLRSQTLYRTVSGFMNYHKALKLLYRVEHPELVQGYGGFTEGLERELDSMARRKFRFVVSMQRYSSFSQEEMENVDFLLEAYPDLQIAYLEEVASEAENGDSKKIYSCLIDGKCEFDENGKRIPKFRIQLPGNPILGDGKSDNQNHSVIFTRGEYLQLVDANQDNYLEEALKIRNVLAEFEQYNVDEVSPYSEYPNPSPPPVAIVGAREYIFSESVGILGDVAAGKEATFGTLTQRIMAKVGGKLHYGHPDFLNSIYINTRGGVSKAQKGLHLNEDIYAGMNAFERGGRIKHTEYFQCGKGRDLGFCSVLNFVTKIGTGMGEQMLSREQYYIGTQLPLDRFLTFFYAHPGFHINNIMIMLAVQLFMVMAICVASLTKILTTCKYVEFPAPHAPPTPAGCYDIWSVHGWIHRTVLSILIVFGIAFIPLFLQILTEQGVSRSFTRLAKQFGSMSPLFEVFLTQIYANSLIQNMSFGGARYIATGRGFAITRVSFPELYSRFATSSIYLGARIMIMLIYVCISAYLSDYIYFYFTALALTISPFLFNPHQFKLQDFLVDYYQLLRWFSIGNSSSEPKSWITFRRMDRIRVVGSKRKRMQDPENKTANYVPRPHVLGMLFSEVFVPVIMAAVMACIFAFNSTHTKGLIKNLIHLAIISLAPIILNAGFLMGFFFVSLCMGPMFSSCGRRFGDVIAGIAHGWAVINYILFYIVAALIEDWNIANAILAMIATSYIHQAIFSVILISTSREYGGDEANLAWWTGRWYSHNLGYMAFTLPLREFLCKLQEMSQFATDFIISHCILFLLFIFCLIPYSDKIHSTMLFWFRIDDHIRPSIYSPKEIKQRKLQSILYGILLGVIFIIFLVVFIFPTFGHTFISYTPSGFL